jgi:hypothetical protein
VEWTRSEWESGGQRWTRKRRVKGEGEEGEDSGVRGEVRKAKRRMQRKTRRRRREGRGSRGCPLLRRSACPEETVRSRVVEMKEEKVVEMVKEKGQLSTFCGPSNTDDRSCHWWVWPTLR